MAIKNTFKLALRYYFKHVMLLLKKVFSLNLLYTKNKPNNVCCQKLDEYRKNLKQPCKKTKSKVKV